MTEHKWDANVLYRGGRVLGWLGYDVSTQLWYARTSGTNNQPFIRGEFDNEQSARDFLQFITTVENT